MEEGEEVAVVLDGGDVEEEVVAAEEEVAEAVEEEIDYQVGIHTIKTHINLVKDWEET